MAVTFLEKYKDLVFHQNPQSTLTSTSGLGGTAKAPRPTRLRTGEMKRFVWLGEKEPYNRDARDKYFPSRGAREKVNEDL